MAMNLPVEAIKAQRDYMEAVSSEDRLKKILIYISKLPKNKATEHMIGNLKQQANKIEEQIEKQKQQKKTRKVESIKKERDGQICLVGIENSGKSAFMNHLCGMYLKSTEVPFETKKVIAGTLIHEDANIQVLEIPSKMDIEYLSSCRITDLIVFVIDAVSDIEAQAKLLSKKMKLVSIAINKKKATVKIIKKGTGGYNFIGKKFLEGNLTDFKLALQNRGLHNADIIVHSKTTYSEFIEALDEKTEFKNAIFIINKCDINNIAIKDALSTSFIDSSNKERIGKYIWNHLGKMRVYTKKIGKKAEKKPMILDEGATVEEFLLCIHREFLDNFKFARVWGPSSKFEGQQVGLTHELKDGDILEVHAN